MVISPFCLAQEAPNNMKNLQGKKIGEYDFNYTYKDTRVTHKIEEFYHAERGITMVTLRKETRKGDYFAKIPGGLWVTKDGYPPLVTDSSLQHVKGKHLTLYIAAIPTVQSEEHINIFDNSLREDLKELGLDYDQLSRGVKEGDMSSDITITGFMYIKKGENDPTIVNVLQDKALKAYSKVLESSPKPCPVHLWRKKMIGPQPEFEYHHFKIRGFDVPLSAQRAFFTMMFGTKECYIKNNQERRNLNAIVNRLWKDSTQ